MIEIVAAARRGRLTNLEITMNTPGAAEQIQEAIILANGQLNIGAGTVTSPAVLEEALRAGASFIVTPTLNASVVDRCVQVQVPVFPGAFSPNEVVRAWELGATMVKIFPAETLGPAYIRSLKAPLPEIKLLPTGGVNLATLPEFLKAGADGFGVGSPLFDPKRIESGDWPWLEAQCRAFAEAYGRWLLRAP
ncbi:MAG: bifunctional 4-hydroxy-2-oxoglutarate aldolase/2-dehydro-3-deoxy-phosphogluconate aldolase [Verrucomicrobiales bacterium]|nr:bifunctional 4-hydroxy-2-oxoglutarate aldolase/2-dehydro-3-deoxy-phosphogluconate aldolase [Verrucomicrobiales bacterium]